jgi:phage regulator Rha-like protein
MTESRSRVKQLLRIFHIRKHQVILDSDLAALYGATTSHFNRAIKRNEDRFPGDFSFVLTKQEFDDLMCQIGTSSSHGGRRKPIRVFTEHGAIMAANVLNSRHAVRMSVYVVRAFVRMREELLSRSNMEKRLTQIEKTLVGHDVALHDLYQKIRPLLLPPSDPPRRRIGFRRSDR